MNDQADKKSGSGFGTMKHDHDEDARATIGEKVDSLLALQRVSGSLTSRLRALGWWERAWPVHAPHGSTETLKSYLQSKNAAKMVPQPMILRWLESPSMLPYLEILDKKVGRLLQRNPGGPAKVREWLLSGDRNFAAVTAERFIIDYLASKNRRLVDPLKKRGVDAVLALPRQNIGVEVTSLNGAIGLWILAERLTQALRDSRAFDDKRVELQVSYERLVRESSLADMQPYIAKIAEAIGTQDRSLREELEIRAQVAPGAGTIAFDFIESRGDWLKILTRDVHSKLAESAKKSQLSEYDRNIVFVCVNHLPRIWPFPMIFDALNTIEVGYESAVDRLRCFWMDALRDHPKVSGICYFHYAIDREGPYFPLRIFWRDGKDIVPINL